MLLPITTEPNEILHHVTKELNLADISKPEFKKLVKNMTETMYIKDGVGIAANQVGQSLQVCVITKQFSFNKNEDLVLINPRWEKLSVRKTTDAEGCLSVPYVCGEVKRYKKIRVHALNQNGQPLDFVAEDYFARIIQHEIDHLNGHLFTEKATKLQRIEPSM